MSPSSTRRVGWWWLLAAASAALILYGSLFPFRFRQGDDVGLLAALATLSFRPTTRGDIVANLLLYLPLGFCLVFAARARNGTALARAVVVGTALSLAVEVTQVYLRFRVPSLTDVVLNFLGTLGGGGAAMAYAALGTSVRLPALASSRLDPAALGVLLLWLGFRLAPFVPTVDWQKYKDALKPLFIDPQIGAYDVLRYVAGWLVVGYALRALLRREYVPHVLLAVIGVVLLGRVVVVGKTLSPAELVALAAWLPLAALLVAMREPRRSGVLAALLAAAIVVQGLAPFEWLPSAQGFSWVPFRSSLRGSIELNYSVLLEKCFWYLSLVWLLTRCRFGIAVATLATAALVAAIEALQMWLPGRSADITDPLLAIAAGLMLLMSRERVELGNRRAVAS